MPGGLDLVGEADDGAAVLRLQLVDALRVAAHAAAAAALLDDPLRRGLDGRDLHPSPAALALDADAGLGALEVGQEVVGEGFVVHEVLEDGVDLLARTLDRGGDGDGLHADTVSRGLVPLTLLLRSEC